MFFNKNLNKKFFLTILIWTLLVIISLSWNIYITKKETIELAKLHLNALFSKDKATRVWASSHGGVYVPSDKKTPPNLYLNHIEERDIKTPSGKELTLMNPAYMLRQMMSDYEDVYGVKGHITSDIYFRQETKPDEWEKKALAKFKKGKKEVYEFNDIDNKLYLRLMRPLYAKKSCLKCHAKQGYKVGDLRGGVSLSIPMDSYLEAEKNSIFGIAISHFIFWIFGSITIFIIFKQITKYLQSVKEFQNNLIEQKEYLQNILDSQKHIVIINDGKKLIDTNQAFLDFFNEYKSISDFHKKHKCICEFFEKVDKEGFIYENMNGKNWIEYLIENRDKSHKVLIKRANKEHIFSLYLNHLELKGKVKNVVVFYDITNLEIYKNSLEEKVKEEIDKRREKEYLLMQHSKDIALNELLINISHHWRQPLTALLSMIDDIEEAYEFHELNKEYISKFKTKSENILTNLSNTITDFNYIYKEEDKKEVFKLKNVIELASSFVNEYFKTLNIKILKELDENLTINGNKNEFIQIILNLINNSRDIFLKRKIKNGVIIIKTFKDIQNKITIEVSDNGGGIKEEIKDKIFEPYFTTKHKTVGAGLGLFIVKSLIENKFSGEIYFENSVNSAKFTIKV